MAIGFFENSPRTMPAFNKRLMKHWIKDVAAGYSQNTGEINYIFCSENDILKINNQFLTHDYFTDIITFDYSIPEKRLISGDIYISPETVRSNAEEYGATFEEELNRVIIHGILHLCGQNDKSAEDEKIMRAKENEALERLNELSKKF
jgi:rRNA maturation RNase YbeY